MSNAGIASATGTRLDSAAKHTMPCKIDDTLLVSWFEVKNNARTALHVNKMKYAVQKDELVLNVTQKLNSNTMGSRAYPSVVSSVTEMPTYVRNALKYLYDSETALHFMQACDNPQFASPDDEVQPNPGQIVVAKAMWTDMPYFTAQGYALGTAFASAQSGDTVSTVLVGGMVTVRNGGFSCRAGEPIMWYFDFEEDTFHKTKILNAVESERVMGGANEKNIPNYSNEQRKRRMAQMYDTTSVGHQKSGVALPKPYVLKRGRDHFGDKIRIFAKCINGGRPYDMIDLMLMTQSM